MPSSEIKRRDVVVVMLGRFNPAIVQPGWLAQHGIIGVNEAKNAVVRLIHPDLTVLTMDLYEIVVETEKLTVKTKDIHPEIIRDLLLKTFGEFLAHTPIRAVGINYMVEIECRSSEDREKFGQRLAPREAWGDWGRLLEGDAPPDAQMHGGLASISMRQYRQRGEKRDWVLVRLEPSVSSSKGISVAVNDHYDVSDIGDGSSAAIEILEKRWDESLKFSAFIVDELIKEANRG